MCEGPYFILMQPVKQKRTGHNHESYTQKDNAKKLSGRIQFSHSIFLSDRQPRKSERIKKMLNAENSSEAVPKAAGHPQRSSPNLPHRSRGQPVLPCPHWKLKSTDGAAGEQRKSDPDVTV